MSAKKIFGIVLTLAGMAGLIYGGMDLSSGGVARASFVYLLLGVIFFFAGIKLLQNTRDKVV
ncbi:hypothetical protein [Arsenicibacter rosenii]|uniref:Uncharacterized protein n=1 Tax=Arsenicibacter rosenii TaxID=1750698 RepID=A0A1S2VLK7_9BACT|nr:hypothetical protein [Arsenicibacter rosenii]OIN59644.1 hypothetical protein BLX24_07170 [Arsenicibacter rosenii]